MSGFRRLFAVFLFFVMAGSAQAAQNPGFVQVPRYAPHAPPSAHRPPQESYLRFIPRHALETLADAGTPLSLQRPIEELDLNQVPALASLAQLQQLFERVRDQRDWRWGAKPDFARRIPWLFIDDGCYLRAELIVEKFREWSAPIPMQVMVFGDLHGANAYSTATWWYHVAPVFRVEGVAYVLDPSIQPRAPMTLSAWVLSMVPDLQSAKGAICAPDVVDPEQDCAATSAFWEVGYEAQQTQFFLEQEWTALQTYLGGAEPTEILGDAPPWLKP
jgi:hypothetical protein